MSKKIVFKISKDGDVRIDQLEGYGSDCMNATKMLERALGNADESSRNMTSEYFNEVEQSATERLHH